MPEAEVVRCLKGLARGTLSAHLLAHFLLALRHVQLLHVEAYVLGAAGYCKDMLDGLLSPAYGAGPLGRLGNLFGLIRVALMALQTLELLRHLSSHCSALT